MVSNMIAKEHFQEPLSPAKRTRLEKIFEHTNWAAPLWRILKL